MSKAKKELPDDISVITENLDKIDESDQVLWVVDRTAWRDFFEHRLRKQGEPPLVEEQLAKDAATIVETVLKRGTVSLGGNCRLIKCPVVSRPSVCALCPLATSEGDHLICSGPTVQRKPGPLSFSKTPKYKTQRFKDHCPYRITRLDEYDPDEQEGVKHLIELVWPVLQGHPDYETVDVREKYADELAEAGIS